MITFDAMIAMLLIAFTVGLGVLIKSAISAIKSGYSLAVTLDVIAMLGLMLSIYVTASVWLTHYLFGLGF